MGLGAAIPAAAVTPPPWACFDAGRVSSPPCCLALYSWVLSPKAMLITVVGLLRLLEESETRPEDLLGCWVPSSLHLSGQFPPTSSWGVQHELNLDQDQRALVPSIPPEIQTQPETGAALSNEPGWSSVESKDLNVLRRRRGMRLRAERAGGQERFPLEM